jgi:hypothetical protein
VELSAVIQSVFGYYSFEEDFMKKKKLLFWSVVVLVISLFVLWGCPTGALTGGSTLTEKGDDESDDGDNNDEGGGGGGGGGGNGGNSTSTQSGVMTKASANKIFGTTGWSVVGNNVTINSFESVTELIKYLESANKIFKIDTIDDKPVVEIGGGAFAATPGIDISKISGITIELPATITTLGANLFANVSASVTVKIPKSVTEKSTVGASKVIAALNTPNVRTFIVPDSSGGTSEEVPLVFVNSVAALEATITSGVHALWQSPLIQLSEQFYNGANASTTTPIVIDPGDLDNLIPYTIRGLGKDKALTVGIVLANDNITLEDVQIAITDANKAAPVPWTSSTDVYRAAVLIGREDGGGLLNGKDRPAKDVTVTNCDISIDLSSGGSGQMTTGIYVCGARTGDTPYAPERLTISNNTIFAKGGGTSATQGVLIHIYDYSIKITNNVISAQYGTQPSGLRVVKPASALYFGWVYGEPPMASGGTPQISGNTLKLEGSSAYSFFINTHESTTVTNDNKGVTALREKSFANAGTTWALAENDLGSGKSSYKKLLNALLANITGTGFGSVSIPYNATSWNYEHYTIDARKVTRISVLGDHIGDGKYKGGSSPNVFNPSENPGSGVDYGSFTVDNNGTPGAKDGKFYFTLSEADNDYIY